LGNILGDFFGLHWVIFFRLNIWSPWLSRGEWTADVRFLNCPRYWCAAPTFQRRVARFFLAQHTKTGKICTKWPQNIPKWPLNVSNGHKIYQHFPCWYIYPNWDFWQPCFSGV
jgi:hypothetical protein